MAILNPGYNIVIKQKLSNGTSKPIYPFTKFANVINSEGETLDEVLAEFKPIGDGDYVPSHEGEITSNLRFLRNDNTWANIQDGTLAQKGVVQLSSSVDSASNDLAATSGAVKTVKDALDTYTDTTAPATYAPQSWIGASTVVGSVQGIAPLDANGIIPTSYLPSYVSDIFDVEISSDGTSAIDEHGDPVVPRSNVIYVNCLGEDADNNTYRWSGSRYAEISKSLVIGSTTGTAFDGGLGNELYTWYSDPTQHARVDATKTESSESNGYIKINGTETLVYTHPQEAGFPATNPHGLTMTDLGMGNVENKSSETIRGEITTKDIRDALGLDVTGAAANQVYADSTHDGIMSKEYAAKLNNCSEFAISQTQPTFTTNNGLWFEVISEDQNA